MEHKIIAIICAMDIELEGYKKLLENQFVEYNLGHEFLIGDYQNNKLVITKCGIGNILSYFCILFLESGSGNMQKGRVLSLRRFGIAEFLNKNMFLISILSFLVLGMVLGVFLFDNISTLNEYSAEYLAEYIAQRTNVAFLKMLLDSFIGALAVLFIFFIFWI
mgnify:CR=1 FL=1